MPTTFQYTVRAFIVDSGKYGGAHLAAEVEPLPDQRQGVCLDLDAGCRLLLNGLPTTRSELLAWLPTVKVPCLDADCDYEHAYGRVVEARFVG